MALLADNFRVKFETLESAFANLFRANVLDLNSGGIGSVTVMPGDPDTAAFPITRLPVLLIKVPHTTDSPRVAIGNKRASFVGVQLTGLVRALAPNPNSHETLSAQALVQCRTFFSNVEAILRNNPKLDGSLEAAKLEYCVQDSQATFNAAAIGQAQNDLPNAYMFQATYQCMYRR